MYVKSMRKNTCACILPERLHQRNLQEYCMLARTTVWLVYEVYLIKLNILFIAFEMGIQSGI